MSELPQVQDEQSLQAWLRVRPGEDAALIAHRAVMRVLPHGLADAGESWAARVGLRSLPNLQLSLSLMVATKFPSPEIAVAVNRANAAVVAAARAASEALQAHPGMTNDRGGFSASVFALAAAALSAANPATAVEAIAHATAIYTNATHDTIARALFARETAATNLASASAVIVDDNIAFWSAVEFDVHSIIEGRGALDLRLWPDGNPTEHLWAVASAIVQQFPGGDFWINWYQNALDGRPQSWPLMRDVALIEEALWQEGGEALDAEIKRLQAKHRLEEIIRDNPYAWRVVIDRKTGFVMAEAVEPRDFTEIVETIRSDIRDFHDRGKKFGVSNFGEMVKYAFKPPMDLLRRDLRRYKNSPLSLFKAIEAARKEMEQIATSEGYSGESYVTRFFDALATAAEDICAQSPEIIEQLKRRKELRYELASIEGQNAVTRQIAGLHLDSEGMLKRVSLEALRIINDPSASDREKKEAWYFAMAVLPRAARAVISVADEAEQKVTPKTVSPIQRAAEWADTLSKLDKGVDAFQENVPPAYSWVTEIVNSVLSGTPPV